MRSQLTCPGPLDRRSFLTIGGLSLGALTSGISPNLPQLLASEATGSALSDEFSVILFWANGGPSHLETFDMKPEAPAEYRGEFKPIPTNVPGMEICELLPNLADRPVVARPAVPFFIPPGEELELFVSTPIWVQLRSGTTDLVELPCLRPSDT